MEMFKEGGGNGSGKTGAGSGNGNGDDRGRVGRFLDILHHYHVVFDVLSQAGDFGYLAVIWGGMRLMLMVSFVSCVPLSLNLGLHVIRGSYQDLT